MEWGNYLGGGVNKVSIQFDLVIVILYHRVGRRDKAGGYHNAGFTMAVNAIVVVELQQAVKR